MPAPPSFYRAGLPGAEGQLGRMPVQGTNGQAHCQLQEAVGGAPGRAAGWRASVPRTWRVETGGGSPEHHFPRAQRLPLAGRAGRWPHLPSLGLGSLLPPSGSRPAPRPALCGRVHTLGNNTHLTCFPESRMARQADSASPVMENRAVGPTQSSLARIPWGLGWETVLHGLGFPRSGIISAQ